jgi:hypothetical protein
MKRPPVLLALCVLLLLAIPPVVLQAAIVVTEKYVGDTSASAVSYTTNVGGTGPMTAEAGSGPFSIATGSLLHCGVVWTGTTPGTVSLTYDGDTMTQIATTTFSTGYAVSVHYITGPRASSHVQITPSNTLTGIGLACYEVAGVDTGSPVIQSKGATIAQGVTNQHTLTMDSPRTPNSVLFHWLGVDGSPTFNTVEYDFISSLTYGTPSTRGFMQWDIGGSDITPLITTNTNNASGNYAVEFAQASAGGGTKPSMLMLGVGEF